MEFLSFLRHHFAGKPVVALGNVSCFLTAGKCLYSKTAYSTHVLACVASVSVVSFLMRPKPKIPFPFSPKEMSWMVWSVIFNIQTTLVALSSQECNDSKLA